MAELRIGDWGLRIDLWIVDFGLMNETIENKSSIVNPAIVSQSPISNLQSPISNHQFSSLLKTDN
jgi:hypothetical protein